MVIGKKYLSDEELEELKQLLDKNVDMTLEEIKTHFNKSCCLSAIHRMLIKLGYRYKKTLKASEQERADVHKKRELWRKFQLNTSCQKRIFLDETGAKTNMSRIYDRALKGARCHEHTPDGRLERGYFLP